MPETEILRRVAAVLLVDRSGRILMQHRDQFAPVNPCKWSFTGGGIEEGEAPEEAARREIREETGITIVHPLHLFHHEVVSRAEDPTEVSARIERFIYAAATSARQEDVILGEGQALAFKTAAEIAMLDLQPRVGPLIERFFASDVYTQVMAAHLVDGGTHRNSH